MDGREQLGHRWGCAFQPRQGPRTSANRRRQGSLEGRRPQINHGAGLESGANLHAARKAKNSLIKGGNFSAARALDFIVLAALGGPIPDAEGRYKQEHICNHCEMQVPATRLHVLYQRPANSRIDNAFIKGRTRKKCSMRVLEGTDRRKWNFNRRRFHSSS